MRGDIVGIVGVVGIVGGPGGGAIWAVGGPQGRWMNDGVRVAVREVGGVKARCG